MGADGEFVGRCLLGEQAAWKELKWYSRYGDAIASRGLLRDAAWIA
jgi:hypothetical protein